MDSKKTTSIYAITNNKIDSLRAFINLSKEMYHSQKKDLNNNDFLEWLKLSCFQIDEKIVDTIEYYQYNVASIKTIEKAKDKCKDLSILLNKYKLELFNGGFSESDYLAYKKVLKDAFDFELSKETKEPLVNYLDVKKEFEDINKIETSTKETENTTKKTVMFELGVRLAIGDLDKYYIVTNNKETQTKNRFTAPKIAEALGHSDWNKFILATLNYYKDGQNQSKNIWINKNIMKQVYKHCEFEKIKMTDFFIEKYNQLTQD